MGEAQRGEGMTTFTESTVESAAIGWRSAHGPDIARLTCRRPSGAITARWCSPNVCAMRWHGSIRSYPPRRWKMPSASSRGP